MAKYRILSLDGGGVRGLITARMLQRLDADPRIAGWLEQVDVIAGTSTGGMLAMALAAGKSPEEISELYLEKAKVIFDDTLWDNIHDLGRTIGAEYSSKGRKETMQGLFGNITLGDLHKKVVIPAFDLDNESTDSSKRSWKPKIFHNFSGEDADNSLLASSVAMYTTAAPTYFPSVGGFIDGGVFANNPSVVAIAQAISQSNTANERAEITELELLSIGTGVSLTYISGQNLNWGYVQWAKPLINILTDGVSGISDYQARELLGDRYHRLQVVFDPGETIALDAVRKMDRMDAIAQAYDLSSTLDWIAAHWR